MSQQKDFENIYKEFAPELFRFCQFRLDNREAAQDIVADTFIKYLQFEGEIEHIRGWLYRVSRNLIYDLRVKDKTDQLTSNFNAEFKDVIADESNLDSLVIKEKNVELLREKLIELDNQTSEIIVLKVWEEMTFKEISEIVELKENAVKKRFYRGISQLQTLLK